jgi:hypothetical protein
VSESHSTQYDRDREDEGERWRKAGMTQSRWMTPIPPENPGTGGA